MPKDKKEGRGIGTGKSNTEYGQGNSAWEADVGQGNGIDERIGEETGQEMEVRHGKGTGNRDKETGNGTV